MRWFGHVERIEEERMIKRIRRTDVSGVRLRERPQMKWMVTVKGALNER